MAKQENPALVVDHGAHEYRQVIGGGGGRKLFVPLTPTLRRTIANQWMAAANAVLARANERGIRNGVVKVKLRSKAIAKSHRPLYLFQQAGRARLVGAREIGTLLVAVSAHSREATRDAILNIMTQDGEADITTIDAITPYSAQDVLHTPPDKMPQAAGVVLNVFDYYDALANEESATELASYFNSLGVEATRRATRRYIVRTTDAEAISALAGHPAVRSIWPNVLVQAQPAIATSVATAKLETPPADKLLPVVGVLDTGVSTTAVSLRPWIAGEAAFAPASADNNDYAHGTFIAGLIAGGQVFNPGVGDLPVHPCRIFSARVFSNYEPLGVEDLIARVQDVVRAHRDVKVWNLSLGSMVPCIGPEFSPFACELDEIAQSEQVLFVVAAGNYVQPPLRTWPVAGWHADGRDLIGPPADAALVLTVGSLAHQHSTDSAVKAGHPTAYSRRGPGPGMLPKPELVHFGGNCTVANTADGCGIGSLSPSDDHVLGWGTSYAAPLVASAAADAWSRLTAGGHQVSAPMVRAVVIHAAATSSASRNPDELRYFGFGVPSAIENVLACEDHEFTTWHRVYVPNGKTVQHEFPMPECLLENGKFRGEIVVTACYAPMLDSKNGAEYCRSNVNVSMGTLKMGNVTKIDKTSGAKVTVRKLKFDGVVPPDPGSQGEGFESSLIEHGFKWSPTKVYRKRFPRGVEGNRWQLRFEVLYRAGETPPDLPQEVFCIVTVRALESDRPVYRDGVRALKQRGHAFNAAVAAGARVRV